MKCIHKAQFSNKNFSFMFFFSFQRDSHTTGSMSLTTVTATLDNKLRSLRDIDPNGTIVTVNNENINTSNKR